MAINLHLVPSLIVLGSVAPLPSMPLWHAQGHAYLHFAIRIDQRVIYSHPVTEDYKEGGGEDYLINV